LTHLTNREHLFAMLTKEIQVEIHVLKRQGRSIREIARLLGASRNTVRAVLRSESDGRYGPRRRPPHKLDPYKAYLRNRVETAGPIALPATVLLREIRALGYDGGYSQLTEYVRTLKPPKAPDAVVRFETEPGKQLQIDFVVFRRGASPLRAFTAELGYSRYPYVEFTDNERAETLIACLERALHWFGGVPQHVLCDNPKTIVIERNAYGDGQHRFNAKLYDLAKHYGFRIHLCAPYRAQTKGKLERFHRYLRESFFNPLQAGRAELVDVALANRAVHPWLREVAGTRIHATLKERPIDRFQLEREHLQALAPPYGGHRRLLADAASTMPVPFESLQHSLATYERFALEIAR
jgi:transposase